MSILHELFAFSTKTVCLCKWISAITVLHHAIRIMAMT